MSGMLRSPVRGCISGFALGFCHGEACSSFSQMEEGKMGWEPAWKAIITGETNRCFPLSKNSFPCMVRKMCNLNILLVSWLMIFDQTGAVAFLLLLSRRIRTFPF